MTTESKDNSKLANAAEELIKAACSQVDSTSLSIGKETVEELKKLKEEMVKLNDSLARQEKNQKLEWAITNAEINSFYYYQNYQKDYNCQKYQSSDFVKTILLSFRQGIGCYITNRTMTDDYYTKNKEEGEKQFRDKLSNQIHELLGHKPRIALADEGYAIYYS